MTKLAVVNTAAAIAIVGVLACAWWIVRTRSRGISGAIRRLSALLLGTMLIVTSTGLMINRQYGFFDSVGEMATYFLSGQSSGPHHEVTPNISRWESDADAYRLALKDSDEQGIQEAAFTGPESGVADYLRVWKPRDYDPANGPYNVIVMLPGVPGRAHAIQTAIGMQEHMQKAIDDGIIPPTIVVSAGMNINGKETNCADFGGAPRVETWLTDDVPNAIRANFAVSYDARDWTILGVSAGGWCAGRLGLIHSDIFGRAVSMHGCDRPCSGRMELDADMAKANSLSTLAKQPRQNPFRLLMVGSVEDPPTAPEAEAIRKADPTAVDAKIYPHGGHGWLRWKNEFPDVLAWIGKEVAATEKKGS